jgi:hypothetical protein
MCFRVHGFIRLATAKTATTKSKRPIKSETRPALDLRGDAIVAFDLDTDRFIFVVFGGFFPRLDELVERLHEGYLGAFLPAGPQQHSWLPQ